MSGQFTKRPFYEFFYSYNIIIIPLKLSDLPKTRSFLIIVVKSCSYIDSEVGNLRKYKYFYEFDVR